MESEENLVSFYTF